MRIEDKILPDIHPKFFWDTDFGLLNWNTA